MAGVAGVAGPAADAVAALLPLHPLQGGHAAVTPHRPNNMVTLVTIWSHYGTITVTIYGHLMVPRVELGWSFSREPSTSLSRSRFSMLEPLGRPWK